MNMIKSLGQQVTEVLHKVQTLATCTHVMTVYVQDTINSTGGQADYDLLAIAANAEAIARDARQLHYKIQDMRQQAETAQPQPRRIPVLTYGH
jgi:hypothetical protein